MPYYISHVTGDTKHISLISFQMGNTPLVTPMILNEILNEYQWPPAIILNELLGFPKRAKNVVWGLLGCTFCKLQHITCVRIFCEAYALVQLTGSSVITSA